MKNLGIHSHLYDVVLFLYEKDKINLYIYEQLLKSLSNNSASYKNLDLRKKILYTMLYTIFGPSFLINFEIRRHNIKINEEMKSIINSLRDDKRDHLGAIVLGLNDALVEVTGSLMGIASATESLRLTGISGIIIGIAASLSMAASEYLSKRNENDPNPLKSAIYTGLAYIIAVLFIVSPYFVLDSIQSAMIGMVLMVIGIIAVYTFISSTILLRSFKKEFVTMLVISLSVTVISYLIGHVLNSYLLSG